MSELRHGHAVDDAGELVLGTALTIFGNQVPEGVIIEGVTIAWDEMVKAFEKDPSLMYSLDPWKMEEIVAGGYKRAGFDEVILTPRSGDGGKDIIAVRHGQFSLRIFDQIKRYKIGHKVTADEVRAMLGVLYANPKVTKVFVTTTSDFAPRLREDEMIKQFLPTRLDLRNGTDLRAFLSSNSNKRQS